MLKSWMVPAACLALAGPAAAVELHASLPIETSPVLARQAAAPKPASLKRAESGRPAPARPAELRRRAEPETTSALPAPPARSSCPPARRVGTGAGFCLVN